MAASVMQESEENSWLEGMNNSSVSTHVNNQLVPGISLPTLRLDQYQQLLSLLNRQSEAHNSSSVGAGFLAGIKFCFIAPFNNGNWIIDSGASDHITPHLNLFFSFQPLKNPAYITMPNGKHSRVSHIGSVRLTSILIFPNVLHVPDF